MKTNQKRNIATSFTTFLFAVMAITGVMMFFHIFDNYTKQLHEILGLAFVAIVFFHLIFNWNSMKTYFSKKIFYISATIISIISLVFILNANEGPNPKRILFNSVINAPIEKSLSILSNDYDEAIMKLEDAGLKIENAKTIKELAKINQMSPFDIITKLK